MFRRLAMACLCLHATLVCAGTDHAPALDQGQQQAVASAAHSAQGGSRLDFKLIAKHQHWDEPAEPFSIVGPLHFVGTGGLGSWLFATREGHILLNSGTPLSGPLIVASIRKLGFRPEDIRIIINSHAHFDHAGALGYLKQLSGAQLAIMREDVGVIEDGGKSDFLYGSDWPAMGQPPAQVDRVLRDGDQVRLGEVVLTAHLTAGHTRGTTTWSTTLVEDGKAYSIVFPDGTGIVPGYRVAEARAPSYPGIEADYRRTLHTLEMLKPDIWLSHHTPQCGLEAKRERATSEGIAAWVDPEGYRQFVAAKRRAFEDQMDEQMKQPTED